MSVNLRKLWSVCILVQDHPVAPSGLEVGAIHLVCILGQDMDAGILNLDLDLSSVLPVLLVLVLFFNQVMPSCVL